MYNPKETFEQNFNNAVKELYGENFPDYKAKKCKKGDFDFGINVTDIAKKLNRNPNEIAKEISDKLGRGI